MSINENSDIILNWCKEQANDHNEIFMFNNIKKCYYYLTHKTYNNLNYGPFNYNELLNYDNCEEKLEDNDTKTFDCVYNDESNKVLIITKTGIKKIKRLAIEVSIKSSIKHNKIEYIEI